MATTKAAPAAAPAPSRPKNKPKAPPQPAATKPTGLGLAPKAWPADKVARWGLKRLLPSARNARTHSPEQVAQLARSIETFGWTMPVLVDEEGVLIAGHGRVMAAQLLGLAEVPVMVAKGWTDEQKRAYALADNQLPMNAGWDPIILRDELKFLDKVGVDMPLLGFNDVELVSFMTGQNHDKEPDEIPPVPAKPVSRPGDLWLLGARVQCPKCQKFTPLDVALAGKQK